MKNFNRYILNFILSVLVSSLFVVPTFASEHGGGGSSRLGPYIYNSNDLNAQVIKTFNSMSRDEQKRLLENLFPIISKVLGFYPKNTDAYSLLNEHYHHLLSVQKLSVTGQSAEAYWNKEGAINRQYYVYIDDNGNYQWYSDLVEPLSNYIIIDNDKLVVSDNSILNYVANDYVDNYAVQNGQVRVELFSIYNLNTSIFYNFTDYNNFISTLNRYNNLKFVIAGFHGKSAYLGIPKNSTNTNIYNDGFTVNGTIKFIDNNGIPLKITDFEWFYFYNSNIQTTGDLVGALNEGHWTYFNSGFYNFGANAHNNAWEWGGSGDSWNNNNWGIYTYNRQTTTYNLYTSLAGWINDKGHFEYPFNLASYFGSVPTSTISSNAMTTYYNQQYTNDNSYVDNSTTIYYPNSFVPDDTSGYDEETNILKFGSITDFLKSIGNFIGSIINGIASGLANIFNAFATITQNILGLINQGFMGFMSALFGWLPAEIVAVISGGIVLIVLFGIIKVIRG